jgi:hypothetical protein
MGLIDSTNRIERAILSDKQARKQEQEQRRKEREELRKDKAEIQLAKKTAKEFLRNAFDFTFSKNGTPIIKSLQTLEIKNIILKTVAKHHGTLVAELAIDMYDTELQKVYKMYLADEKAKGIKHKTPEEKIIDKINVARTIWHALKIVVYGSLLLAFSPVILARLICGDPSKPKRRRLH